MFKNSLDHAFMALKRRKKKALIGYLAGGYPAFPEEKRLIKVMAESGIDVFEIGIPFSDPIADGPTIQFASQQALKNGASVKKILAWIRSWKNEVNVPLVIMSYINPILAYGLEKFAREAAAIGVAGLIVPDMIPEEAAAVRKAVEKNRIHYISMVAPTTPPERQRAIAKQTNGFLYAVSVAGVTGARRALPAETKAWLGRLQKMGRAPVCVGFGISGPDQIKNLRNNVDGFIVGSALIDVIRKNKPAARRAKMKTFVSSLVKECSYVR